MSIFAAYRRGSSDVYARTVEGVSPFPDVIWGKGSDLRVAFKAGA